MFKKVLMITILFFSIATSVNAASLYEVKKGDTLTKIAKTYKVTINDLRTWNKLKNDNIFVKQKLIVEKPKNTTTTTTANQPIASTKPVITVKPEVIQVKIEQPTNLPASPAEEAKQLSVNGQAIYSSIIDFVSQLQGIPYLYGGSSIAGFDCSGFIYFVHSQAGLPIVRQSSESYFAESATVINPIAGDLVFFEDTYKEGISHMGIYLGDNQFIHAGSNAVEIASLDSMYWKEHFVSFKRFHTLSVN